MRIYNPGLGKFLSVDPITKQYPELTPYQFASNSPIAGVDLDGKEFEARIVNTENGKAKITVTDKSDALNKVAIQLVQTLKKEAPGMENFDGVRGFVAFSPDLINAVWIHTTDENKIYITHFTTDEIRNAFDEVQVPIDRIQAGLDMLAGEGKSGGPRGTNIPRVREGVEFGNKVHYDQLNGSVGEGGPTELQSKFPETEFEFTKRGQKGADVKVTGGKHPSEYPNSFWNKENNYADFKPNTKSGDKTFKRDIKSGKLPENTQKLPYNNKTGKLE